jgi:hypothetical protein
LQSAWEQPKAKSPRPPIAGDVNELRLPCQAKNLGDTFAAMRCSKILGVAWVMSMACVHNDAATVSPDIAQAPTPEVAAPEPAGPLKPAPTAVPVKKEGMLSFEVRSAILAKARTLECSFPNSEFFDFDKLTYEPVEPSSFTFRFDNLEPAKGTGRLIGNNGGGNVSVHLGLTALSMLEFSSSGNPLLTVVFPSLGWKRVDGFYEFAAFSSRYLGSSPLEFGPNKGKEGLPIISQLNGACKILASWP